MAMKLSSQPQRKTAYSVHDRLMQSSIPRPTIQHQDTGPARSPDVKMLGLDRRILEDGMARDPGSKGPAASAWTISPPHTQSPGAAESAQPAPQMVGVTIRPRRTQLPSVQRETEQLQDHGFKQKLRDATKGIELMQLKHEKEKEVLQLENHCIRIKQKFLADLDPNFWGKFQSFSEMAKHLRCEFGRLVRCNDKLYAACAKQWHGNEDMQQLLKENQELVRENRQLQQWRDAEITARQNESQANGTMTTIGMLEERLRQATKQYMELDATKGGQLEHLKKQLDEKDIAVRRAAVFVEDVTKSAKQTEEELAAHLETIKKLVDTQGGDREKYTKEIERYCNFLQMAYDIANCFAEQFKGSQKEHAQEMIMELRSSLASLQGPSD